MGPIDEILFTFEVGTCICIVFKDLMTSVAYFIWLQIDFYTGMSFQLSWTDPSECLNLSPLV